MSLSQRVGERDRENVTNYWIIKLISFWDDPYVMGLDSAVKNSPGNAGNRSSVPCLGRSPGEGDPCVCIESVMLSNHLILCHPLLLLPSAFQKEKGMAEDDMWGT